MFTPIDIDEAAAQSVISTGHLPPDHVVAALMTETSPFKVS